MSHRSEEKYGFESSGSRLGLTWEKHYKPVVKWITILVSLIWVLFPVYFAFALSLKTPEAIFSGGVGIPFVTFDPAPLDRLSWTQMWSAYPFLKYTLATLIVSIGAALLATAAAIFAAYSFARLRFPWKKSLFILLITGFIFPAVLLTIPLFVVMYELRLVNTYIGMILAFTAFTLPYNIWLLRGFFEDLPENLEEAARVDGCTQVGAFFRVILPISRPAVASVFLLAFLLSWHNFVTASVLSKDPLHTTLSPGIMALRGTFYVRSFHYISAGIFLTMIVPILMYMYLQKHLIEGFSISAGVKG